MFNKISLFSVKPWRIVTYLCSALYKLHKENKNQQKIVIPVKSKDSFNPTELRSNDLKVSNRSLKRCPCKPTFGIN